MTRQTPGISNLLVSLLAVAAALAMTAASAFAAEIRLAPDPALWQTKLFNLGTVPESEAATFSIASDGISIGPWLAGDTSARLEYSKRLPLVRGMILGRYRTAGLLPRQAQVRVQFYAGERALDKRSIALPAAEQGADLAVAIPRSPAGADAITVGFGLGELSAGKVTFSDLRVSDQAQLGSAQPAALPALTRPKPPRDFPSMPWFHIEHSGEAWWLVKPDGKPFFSLGSVLPWTKRQGEGTAPERATFAEMQRLGLNSTAGSHDVRRWAAFNVFQLANGQPTVVQFANVETRVGAGYDTLVDSSGNNPGASQAQAAAKGGFNHAFPDPFDPRWEAALRKRVHEVARLVNNEPYFAGWFADNERAHANIHRYVWSTHCAAEFLKFLKSQYAAIAALNKAWGTSFASFDDLAQKKPEPALRQGVMYEDFRLFSREIIRQFNKTVLAVIRQEHPGHLVFSNRFMIGEIRDMLDNLDLYKDFDALAVNIYPSNTAPGLDPSERQLLETIHQRTGKPVLIAEWSVPALDSGLYADPAHLDWSAPQAVETQAQRAQHAAQIVADLYNMPFVIGAHWFTWNDINNANRQANRGLFKANGQPWPELQDALIQVHHAIER